MVGSTVGGACDGAVGVAAGWENDGVGVVVGVVCNGVPAGVVCNGVPAGVALAELVPEAARLLGDE